jgi:hypothetical protein
MRIEPTAARRALMHTMPPKHHHMPLSGGDRKALTKELSKSRAMTKFSRSDRRKNGSLARR